MRGTPTEQLALQTESGVILFLRCACDDDDDGDDGDGDDGDDDNSDDSDDDDDDE